MAQILSVTNEIVSVGDDNGGIVTVPLSAVNYANPKVGDPVSIYRDGDKVIIAWNGQANPASGASADFPGAKTVTINKHLFVWVGCFLCGSFGVDRFLRGQIGLGIVKLLFSWATFGIWPLVDFIIGLVKAYGTFSQEENLTFVNGQYAR